MTALVKSAAKTGGGVTVDPETGEIIQGGPLTGMPLAGGAQGLPAAKTIKPISDAGFVTQPSHLLDALMKQWREKAPQLEAQTFADTLLSGEGTGTSGDMSLQFNDIMSPIVAQATKLQEQFKLVAGARGVIDQWLFGQLHAEDIKESLEMIKTNWEWFEKSKLLEERTAMNKVMNDEWQITKDLNEANRQRKDYQISAVDLINAEITATRAMIQAETDRYNAMRPSAVAGDWSSLNAQGQKIDELREKLKDLNTQLKVIDGTFADGFQMGLRKFVDEVGSAFKQAVTFANNCSNAMRDTWQSVFVDAMHGNLNTFQYYFQKFTDKLIDSWATMLANMLQQWITTQAEMAMAESVTGDGGLLGSLFGSLFGGPTPSDASGNLMGLSSAELMLAEAKGDAFQGGRAIRFGMGGIVNRPTLFRMANGAGMMGEAGPEAVMPLSRTSDGKLGVKMAGGGGGDEIHHHWTINAMDSRSVAMTLAQHQEQIIGIINKAYNKRGYRGPSGA